MWRRQHEYSVAELLDHPVLGLLMTGTGIEHRAVALLVGPVVQMKEATPESRDGGSFAIADTRPSAFSFNGAASAAWDADYEKSEVHPAQALASAHTRSS